VAPTPRGRSGRSGRVQNGVCIRLYSEEDFSARPQFTQPEIQRANLAEVILRMKAYHLGEIETFPFINPPAPASIKGGYQLLEELGALDNTRALTQLGRDLARLPIDPTLGRMLLQAQHEHATRELLIIAAGLSIQDPRERPLDQKDAAATAHKRFVDPRSDFLTLLNIWNAVHEQWETLRTQNQRRKFCKVHFLSYIRMREWQDLHAQLQDALEDLAQCESVKAAPFMRQFIAQYWQPCLGILLPGLSATCIEPRETVGSISFLLLLFLNAPPIQIVPGKGAPGIAPGSRRSKQVSPNGSLPGKLLRRPNYSRASWQGSTRPGLSSWHRIFAKLRIIIHTGA